VKTTTPIIYEGLQTIFGRHSVETSVVSVYCHQTPKVRFPDMHRGSCELGDLLFVHVHTNEAHRATRNALLYQAKMSAEQPYRLPLQERDQLKLYAEWPEFEYHNSGQLNGQRRAVRPRAAHAGAQYMLIDDRGPNDPLSGLLMMPGTYPIGSCMPDELLLDHDHLASELVTFLTLRSGRVFESREDSIGSAGWSQVVWDLLDQSISKGFRRMRTGWTSNTIRLSAPEALDGFCLARTTSTLACTTANSLLGSNAAEHLFASNSERPPDREQEGPTGQSSPGISIVLIETSEAGLRRFDSRD
jgi:hypothetical protein